MKTPNTPETTIYSLSDPDTGLVKYVGKSVRFKQRCFHHCNLKLQQSKNTKLSNWLAKVLLSGKKPIINVIEICFEDWAEREKFWIAHYRLLGFNICNITDGGDGVSGRKMSESHRLKISQTHKGKKKNYLCAGGRFGGHSDETKLKISNIKKGISIVGVPAVLYIGNTPVKAFKSLKDASDFSGQKQHVISASILGRTKTNRKNYIWKRF